jgi:hypothetical protein
MIENKRKNKLLNLTFYNSNSNDNDIYDYNHNHNFINTVALSYLFEWRLLLATNSFHLHVSMLLYGNHMSNMYKLFFEKKLFMWGIKIYGLIIFSKDINPCASNPCQAGYTCSKDYTCCGYKCNASKL